LAKETVAGSVTAGQPRAPRKSLTLSDRVYGVLASRISSGIYGPESRLPSEHELAAQFEVSRPVVRDALDRLRADGLIHSRQGSGSYVRDVADTTTRLAFTPVETIADIQRCYEFRLTIEPDGAYLAAQRRNGEILARLMTALDLLADATRQQVHREDVDFAFHYAIAEGANNHFFPVTLLALRDHIAVAMQMHGRSLLRGAREGLETVLDEHRQMYDAIERQDAERARQLMRAHLQDSRDRLFEGRLLDLSLK
jgi:GntR family transcriptional regulator, transcriptional repressor for pyruvate dehydrogenase complex